MDASAGGHKAVQEQNGVCGSEGWGGAGLLVVALLQVQGCILPCVGRITGLVREDAGHAPVPTIQAFINQRPINPAAPGSKSSSARMGHSTGRPSPRACSPTSADDMSVLHPGITDGSRTPDSPGEERGHEGDNGRDGGDQDQGFQGRDMRAGVGQEPDVGPAGKEGQDRAGDGQGQPEGGATGGPQGLLESLDLRTTRMWGGTRRVQ